MTRRTRSATATVAVGVSAVALTIAACAPGGGGDGGDGGNGGGGADDGVITIFSQQGADSDLNTNEFTLFLEEEFDVDLQFETTTWDSASAGEARQITLASGDYPDAFLLIPWVNQFSQAELIKLGDQGVIRPLNDLLEENAPNLQAAWETTPEWEALGPQFDTWGWVIVAASTLSPLSTKFTCMAAGAFGVPLLEFVLALFGGRAVRFLLVGSVIKFAGGKLTRVLERWMGRPADTLT